MAGETPGKGSPHRGRSHPANHSSAQNQPTPEQWSVEHLNGRSMPAKIYLLINQGCSNTADFSAPGTPSARFTLGIELFGVELFSLGHEVWSPATVCGASASPAGTVPSRRPASPRRSARAAASGSCGQSSAGPVALVAAGRFRKSKPPSPEAQSKQPQGHGAGGAAGLGRSRGSRWALQRRVGWGRLPRENKNKSRLGIVSACKHFHTTSAALN